MGLLRMLTVLGVVLFGVCGTAIAQTVNLAGEYTCHAYCPAGGEGRIARIEQRGTALMFINEGGGRSAGSFIDASTVVANDWGSLRATVQAGGQELRWANGTVWRQSAAAAVNLAGDYICHAFCPAGGEGRIARVEQRGTNLVFINEGGGRSNGSFVDSSTVVANDWGGLRATVQAAAQELRWTNGTVWRRSAATAVNLTGDYVCYVFCPAGGEGRIARVEQQGTNLVFINEGGNRSNGSFVDAATVVANDWGGLRATVQGGGQELHWANRTVWRRR